MIHMIAPMNVYIHVLTFAEGNIVKVISHKQWGMTYTGDTIFDVNGDGRKDFVVNWYGSTGCCLKGFSDVYIARKNHISFTEPFEFINPTFSPEEHVVRGICYGHPGDTEMYKYKWNGEKIDTIEYVMFEKDTAGNNIGVLISKQRNSKPSNIIRKQKHVPTEYKLINDFGWFMDN